MSRLTCRMQNRIKEHRERMGWTQPQLAEAAGTTPQQISRLERSERRLSDKWLAPIAKALDVPKGSLLIESVVAPSFTPGKGDLAKDETERRLLRFWRDLSSDAQDFILTMLDAWADRFGGADDK